MMKRYQSNQCKMLKEHFNEHPYYKLCRSVFDVFQEMTPSIVISPEQLFADASISLDIILQLKEDPVEYCERLWNETYIKYREQDGTSAGKEDTQVEVTMLFYMVMYGVKGVNHSFYRGKLQRILHTAICKYYDRRKCFEVESKLREKVNVHTESILNWMTDYILTSDSLTNEIERVLHPKKETKPKKKSKADEKTPYVLKYVCPDERTRNNRLQRAMILMQNWNWIEEPMCSDDFFDFFDGEPRLCNLKWKSGKGGTNVTVLTYVIQTLYEQPFFEKQKGASVLAILRNQFGLKDANYQFKKRVSQQNNDRLKILILVLNPNVQFRELPSRGHGDGIDYSDAVMNAVYSKELHIVKDLDKIYE